jgi:N-acetylglucosamine kinase-like BadF-type ATPase
VVRQSDERGAPTLLTGRLLQHLAIAEPQDLVQVVYYRKLRPPAIAALATHANQAAVEGDRPARDILAEGADELVGVAKSVMTRLGIAQAPFVCVLASGIFQAVPSLSELVTRRLPEVAPRCHVTRLSTKPAAGAVRLAIDELHGGAIIPVYL